MRRLSGLEAESASDEIPDKDMIQTLNSLDEDGQAIAKAWVEKIKLNKLTHTGTPSKFAEKLFAMGLISAEDKNIFKPKEASIERQKREAEEEQGERMTDLKDMGDTYVDSAEKMKADKEAAKREVINLTPDMMTEKGSLTSEQVAHKEYQRIREMMDTDPNLEPLKDDLENLLGFSWNDVQNPPKKSFFKGLTDKILGTPSVKEQRLQAVAEASYLVSNLMRTPRMRDSAVSKAQQEMARRKNTL